MNNDETVVRRTVVNKILQVAQSLVDTERKGWRVKMREFSDAMDDLALTARKVRAAIGFLQSRMWLIAFSDEDGHISRISLMPRWYQCRLCNVWLDMRDGLEHDIDGCLTYS